MATYAWPGNLRELRNTIERAVILAPSAVLEPEDMGLPADFMSMLGKHVAGDALDAPPREIPALHKLLTEASVLDGNDASSPRSSPT